METSRLNLVAELPRAQHPSAFPRAGVWWVLWEVKAAVSRLLLQAAQPLREEALDGLATQDEPARPALPFSLSRYLYTYHTQSRVRLPEK